MSDHYILDGHEPIRADLKAWANWYEVAGDSRRVASTKKGDVFVSTVFLGIDHRVGGGWGAGAPLLFETMIFGGDHNEYQERCSTWEQAEKMHADACKLAFGEEPTC